MFSICKVSSSLSSRIEEFKIESVRFLVSFSRGEIDVISFDQRLRFRLIMA